MGSRQIALLLAGTLAVGACGGGPPAAEPRVAAARPIAASEPAAPTGTPAPTAAGAAAAPAPEAWSDVEASPSAAELQPGARAVRASEWAKARKELAAALEQIKGTAPLDEVLAGQALLGRACAALADTKCAEEAYDAVLAAWKGSETAKKVLDGAGSDEAARKERLHRAVLAVGEALFFAAEQRRHALDLHRAPAYSGAGTKEAIRVHVDEKVLPWAKQKQLLVEEAEAAYGKISELEPAPPRWVVDASARVGTTWGRFAAEFRAAPIPSDWKRDGPVTLGDGMTRAQLRAAYYAAMDSASVSQRRRAREAFEKCRTDAAKLGYKDELSKSCDAWLEKNR